MTWDLREGDVLDERKQSLPGHMAQYDAILTRNGERIGLHWNEVAKCYYEHLGTVIRRKDAT